MARRAEGLERTDSPGEQTLAAGLVDGQLPPLQQERVESPSGDGEELLLLVERTRAWRGDPAAIAEAAREAVSSRTGVRPHTVRILEPGTLPRTSSGKMRRREALRRFQAGTLLPPGKVNVLSVAREVVAGRLARARARR